jgi:cell volume regulation protein A
VWVPGLVLGLALAVVIRPLLVGLCLLPAGLGRNERSFVLFAGLKGAVPILLGSFVLAARVDDAERIYGIVIVVVAFSVIVQGSLVPTAASRLRVPMRTVEPEPWALGVRLRDEPDGVHRLQIRSGSAADGRTIEAVSELPQDAWISLVVRSGTLVPVRGQTTLHSGDEVLVLADPALHDQLVALFERPTEP